MDPDAAGRQRLDCTGRFSPNKPWEHGYVHFGFHGSSGAQHPLHYNEHWLGCLTPNDEWL